MRKCLKITVLGKVQDTTYKSLLQKHAQTLGIEGTLQNFESNGIIIYACGRSDNLDKFIDILYKGTGDTGVKELLSEPFVNEKDFRGVFRIIGD